MADVFATIIVPAANVAQARTLAAEIPGGEGMFTSELSASGSAPATHYISSGFMPEEIITACSMCDVSELAPEQALAAKGLKPCAQS